MNRQEQTGCLQSGNLSMKESKEITPILKNGSVRSQQLLYLCLFVD